LAAYAALGRWKAITLALAALDVSDYARATYAALEKRRRYGSD
jgi:hypothetical protein